MRTGRPVEYRPEYATLVDDYLATCGPQYDEHGKRTGFNLPKIEGYALFIGVTKSTVYEWEQKYDDFSDALEKIRAIQHNTLVDRGVTGEFNSTITKLMLSHNHGYTEKTDFTSLGEKIAGATLVIPPDSATAIMAALKNWGITDHATLDTGASAPSDTHPAN